MKAKSYCVVALLLITSGCVTISEKAGSVQVHSQVSNLLDNCKRIGPVSAIGRSMLSAEQAVVAANVKLRESTADKGGDTVAVLNTDNLVNFTTWEARMQGIAFKCY